MNLADPDLELVDPTPNIHSLFLHFDKLFFWTKLASRAVVRWSKRMYSCAGICSYDRGGLCDIALSEPLLKLRPRKDLVETLLHEMIHAYLFITCRDRDRDGHGPNFKAHMYRINQAAGVNISIYHDFHEEVQLYQTHWWRCNGPCQTKKPHFGIVRRSMNRAPGPSDYWWDSHKRNCGGTFVKIKEPEKPQKKRASPQPTADITKYVNVTDKKDKILKPILKESNNVPVKINSFTKSNSNSTIVVTKKNNIVFNPKVTMKSPVVFSGKGQPISSRSRTNSASVVETVRNIWANKQLPITISNINNTKQKQVTKVNNIKSTNSNKHKADETQISSPPAKLKKIDDYFKSSATSVLKDLYGQDFVIKEVKNNNSNKRLSVTAVTSDLVDCPVCSDKISDSEINRHLDECLNKDIIKNMANDNVDTKPVINIRVPDNVTYNIIKNKDFINNIKEENTIFKSVNIKTESIGDNDLSKNAIDTSYKGNISSPVLEIPTVKTEPSSSEDDVTTRSGQKCPCCGELVIKQIDEHLDECLAFFDNDSTIPSEGASTSYANETIVIDDDDICNETLTLNATGTKSPCPCCLKMIELADMNNHLDICLS